MTHTLINGDCLDVLRQLDCHFDAIFADPPDGIDLGYSEYNDRTSVEDYEKLAAAWVEAFCTRSPVVWLSFNARWTFLFGSLLHTLVKNNSDWEAKPAVQVFTFGQHRESDLGNNHRPLWRLRRKDAPLYPDSIRVPSWRQRNGDKRASPKGRVPGDVFDFQYESQVVGKFTVAKVVDGKETVLDSAFNSISVHPGDVFDFPRVTGNSQQRCDWHPTQLHEGLVERALRLVTDEGATVLDPFGGTGTTLRVCKTIGRDCTLIEMDSGYCSRIAEAHPDVLLVPFQKILD